MKKVTCKVRSIADRCISFKSGCILQIMQIIYNYALAGWTSSTSTSIPTWGSTISPFLQTTQLRDGAQRCGKYEHQYRKWWEVQDLNGRYTSSQNLNFVSQETKWGMHRSRRKHVDSRMIFVHQVCEDKFDKTIGESDTLDIIECFSRACSQ